MTSLTDLREVVDVVIGVDNQVHTHSAAVIDSATGGVLGEVTVGATAAGYAELVEFANPPNVTANDGTVFWRSTDRPRRRVRPLVGGVDMSFWVWVGVAIVVVLVVAFVWDRRGRASRRGHSDTDQRRIEGQEGRGDEWWGGGGGGA